MTFTGSELQEYLDAVVSKRRQQDLQQEKVLTVRELLLLLDQDKLNSSQVVYFDFASKGETAYPFELISWRGYYNELCFTYAVDSDLVVPMGSFDLVVMLNKAIGRSFEGYKGGQYIMGPHTPVHVAQYGETGNRSICGVDISPEKITLQTYEVDHYGS